MKNTRNVRNTFKRFENKKSDGKFYNSKLSAVCYLGYGSPAKLLPAAIKKVITVPSELQCKKECIRLRETTAFKCYAFSYG